MLNGILVFIKLGSTDASTSGEWVATINCTGTFLPVSACVLTNSAGTTRRCHCGWVTLYFIDQKDDLLACLRPVCSQANWSLAPGPTSR